MQRRYDDMKRRAVQDAKLEKAQIELARRQDKEDRRKQRRAQEQKEQLVEILKLQKREREVSHRAERERDRASHLQDLSLLKDEALVQAYPPMRQVPERLRKEAKSSREQKLREALQFQIQQKSEDERRAHVKTAEEHKRRLEVLRVRGMEERERDSQKKRDAQAECERQWAMELEVRHAKKRQKQRSKQLEHARYKKEQRRQGSLPPEAYLPDRRVQLKNAITGEVYYPRPTHASLAIRALKNRRGSSRTLSPISEPGVEEPGMLTRRVQSRRKSSPGSRSASSEERERDSEPEEVLESPFRGKRQSDGGGGGQRDIRGLEKLLRKKAEAERTVEEKLRAFEDESMGGPADMAKTHSSTFSTKSGRRFYSMDKLKAALKKSMATGLYKKRKSHKGDQQVVSAYLFEPTPRGGRDDQARSPSSRKIQETRESYSGAPSSEKLIKKKHFRKHQRSLSDATSPDGGGTVEREILERQLAQIREIEEEEAKILLEGERVKRKDERKQEEAEQQQRAKRMLHNKELKEQIRSELRRKKKERAEERSSTGNELFPKIEEPPEEETIAQHKLKIKTQQQMLEAQVRERKQFMERALLASRGNQQHGILADLWDKSGARAQVQQQQKHLVSEWRKEAEMKRVQKDAEKLVFKTREPVVLEEYFQKAAPKQSALHSVEIGNTPQPQPQERRSVTAQKPTRVHLPGVRTPVTSKYVKLSREGGKRGGGLPGKLTGLGGEWMPHAPSEDLGKAGGSSPSKMSEKQELMNKLSERMELNPLSRQRVRLNETFDEKSLQEKRPFLANLNHSIDGGKRFGGGGGVTARGAGQESARGRRGTSGAIMTGRSKRNKEQQQKPAGGGGAGPSTLFPWEQRETSLRQQELLGGR